MAGLLVINVSICILLMIQEEMGVQEIWFQVIKNSSSGGYNNWRNVLIILRNLEKIKSRGGH